MLQHSKTQTKKTSAKGKTTASQGNKASGTKQSAKREQAASPVISSQQRKQMINEAAFYIAQSRGFIGGNPMDDWLQAEAEVDKQLSKLGR